jgi:FtsH-binding integral membrane protein
VKNLVDGVKNNSYLGILFLLPALAFSLAARGFKKDEKGVSADSLKEVFYAQCYYFTPVSLATYLVLYGFHFSTSGDWVANILLVLAFVAVCVWFFIVEVNAVYEERKFEKKRSAFVVVIGTLILILVVSFFALILIGDPEMLRSWSYTLVKWGIIFVALYYLILRRAMAWWKKRKEKKSGEQA